MHATREPVLYLYAGWTIPAASEYSLIMASLSLVLGSLLALPALWLPTPGILLPLGPSHGTLSSVNDTSAMSPYAVLVAPDSTAFSVSPSPWWTACMTRTPSSALFDKALVSSSSAYLSVLFDAQYPNATLMDDTWKPPWPFLENRAKCMIKRDSHGTYNHGLHHCWHSANCYTFLCELIIGFLLNPEWRECWASVLMAIAVCTISLLRPPSIILLTRLVLATTIYMVNKYMQVVVRIILLTGFIVTSIFGIVGYYITRTAITIIYRLILVAWSPITTTTLLACRIILLSRQCPDADGRPRMRPSGACAGCVRPGAWSAASSVDGKSL